jgi:HlyD family secretion protein
MTNQIPNNDDLLAQVIDGNAGGGRFSKRKRLWIIGGAIAVILVVLLLLIWRRNNEAKVQYVTTDVVRGDLTVSISATGNLAPTNQVDVGSELSGTVISVFVDDNDKVKKGQVLAQLDTSKLNDEVAKSKANLVSAEATLAQMRATVAEARATLSRQLEVQKLSGGKVPAKTEIDTAEANLQRALAQEDSAKGAVENTRAELSSNQTNIKKATICSPVDGVVLDRQIEPGQTVAASFSAPVLFTIAESLTQMELQVDVDEADVGDVRAGLAATFTVDTYPDRVYHATVKRVSLGSQATEGIVSYETILTFSNDDLSLRPGMTGNAEITTVNRQNVILVPSAALRWSPPTASAETEEESSGGLVSSLLPGPPGRDDKKVAGVIASTEKVQTLWVLRNGKPVSIRVTVGASNGRLTEVSSAKLELGMKVISETVSIPQ